MCLQNKTAYYKTSPFAFIGYTLKTNPRHIFVMFETETWQNFQFWKGIDNLRRYRNEDECSGSEQRNDCNDVLKVRNKDEKLVPIQVSGKCPTHHSLRLGTEPRLRQGLYLVYGRGG